ncbi:hypothetical protein [Streptomyces regalis]|uniref:Uncharacterized protein n=1 Tax=Streptomyces regalis TaxID=68262 RepID=A0A117MLT3_9ACTN|nr:hypothetical protein [Streptomyces regalis]KUL24445.1 hypothetical protein ADL12_37035 [Streptomyces regalis]
MSAHAAERDPIVPPMPERTPKALREAIAQHTPKLLRDFDEHWRWAIADAYNVGPAAAFVAFWWGEYAIARDRKLDAHVHDLEHRAAYECTDIEEAKALLEEVSKIRYRVRELEPGE